MNIAGFGNLFACYLIEHPGRAQAFSDSTTARKRAISASPGCSLQFGVAAIGVIASITSVALSTRRTEAFATRPFVADPVVAHVPEAAAPVTFDLESIVGSAIVECGSLVAQGRKITRPTSLKPWSSVRERSIHRCGGHGVLHWTHPHPCHR